MLSFLLGIVASSPLSVEQDYIVSPYADVKFGENQYWKNSENAVKENFNVFTPNFSSDRGLPLVLFFSGFGANLPSIAYSNVLNEISSKALGAVVVALDAFWTNPTNLTSYLERTDKVIDFFVKENSLQQFINTKFKNSVKVDPQRLYFVGHSSGNQIAAVMSKRSNLSKGLILLDPVDKDPMNSTQPVITGSWDLELPVLVVSSELGEKVGINLGKVFPPCCPPGWSSRHFYDAFSISPKYNLVANYYGHADILDEGIANLAHLSHFCATVEDTKLHPFAAYQNFVSGSVAAFIALYDTNNCSYQKFLVDVKTFNTPGTSENANINKCLE